MKTKLLYLFTRTPLHVGAGPSVGAIDQPIVRERHTGFPIIPGSSIKGVLRDHLASAPSPLDQASIDRYFGRGSDGKDFEAGHISFGEAKLITFPVRSAKGAFALVTCNLALQRLAREASIPLDVPTAPKDGECLACTKTILTDQSGKKAVVLEEYRYAVVGDFSPEWEKQLSGTLSDAVLRGAGGRFVLLSDGDFAHFATNACPVLQHVSIDDQTGTAKDGGLFNEEVVPSESLFYSPLTLLRKSEEKNSVFDALVPEQLIQFGGNGTTGLGYCTAKLI